MLVQSGIWPIKFVIALNKPSRLQENCEQAEFNSPPVMVKGPIPVEEVEP